MDLRRAADITDRIDQVLRNLENIADDYAYHILPSLAARKDKIKVRGFDPDDVYDEIYEILDTLQKLYYNIDDAVADVDR